MTDRANALQTKPDSIQEKAVNVEQFISLGKQYTKVEELTPKIINEFIKRIIVYALDKSSGKRMQMVRIIYNLVGEVSKREKKTA